ncbi:hypothetical protein [Winogradskyella sp. 4-2091]|uniref:hypothetical protein n=1 Tax=Winogradskyella sp. 4-2091 TaxID=3381659 RepID=UPI003891902F
MSDNNNPTEHLKLYSQRSIGIASFIGSPLAAGYLINQNYKALNEPEKGNKTLILSIIVTIIIFGSMFTLPEYIVDKIPRMIIPAVYTGIIYLIVEKIHGNILNNHLEKNNEFYSSWRAVGIGFLALILITSITFAILFALPDKVYDTYETEFEQFSKNEEASLQFYDYIDKKDNSALITELNEVSIPKWKENIEIINKTNTIEGLPPELIERNDKLMTYSKLRLEAFELFKKRILYDSESYDKQLRNVHDQIDAILNQINQ